MSPRERAEWARAAWEEHYNTCDDPDFCAHDAPSLDFVEELEDLADEWEAQSESSD